MHRLILKKFEFYFFAVEELHGLSFSWLRGIAEVGRIYEGEGVVLKCNKSYL